MDDGRKASSAPFEPCPALDDLAGAASRRALPVTLRSPATKGLGRFGRCSFLVEVWLNEILRGLRPPQDDRKRASYAGRDTLRPYILLALLVYRRPSRAEGSARRLPLPLGEGRG